MGPEGIPLGERVGGSNRTAASAADPAATSGPCLHPLTHWPWNIGECTDGLAVMATRLPSHQAAYKSKAATSSAGSSSGRSSRRVWLVRFACTTCATSPSRP